MVFFLMALLGFLPGVLVASLGEYWVHRLMHWQILKAIEHVMHHRENAPRGWLHEYWAYARPAGLPIVLVAGCFWYFLSVEAAVGWFIGAFGYMAFTAYTHEMYHTDPNLVFWIRRPLHYFHHERDDWEHNFAFTTTLWDRLFGTFKDDPEWQRKKVPLRGIFSIRWV
jgi:sterol desaturase/sphingolipid hydroxylase (fatty acid hydroxylase superfamily)